VLARLGGRPEQVVLDAVRDHVHTVGVEPERVEGVPADELAGNDHRACLSRGPVVGEAAERAPRRGEELGEVVVLQIVEREHACSARPRHRHRERVVDDLDLAEHPSKLAREAAGDGHRRDPRRATVRAGQLVYGDSRKPLGGVAHAVGHERRVVERADRAERAQEVARVGLRSPLLARGEREQGDPDVHRADPTEIAPGRSYRAARMPRCPLPEPKMANLQGFRRETPSTSRSSSGISARRCGGRARTREPRPGAPRSGVPPARRPSGSGRCRPTGRSG